MHLRLGCRQRAWQRSCICVLRFCLLQQATRSSGAGWCTVWRVLLESGPCRVAFPSQAYANQPWNLWPSTLSGYMHAILARLVPLLATAPAFTPLRLPFLAFRTPPGCCRAVTYSSRCLRKPIRTLRRRRGPPWPLGRACSRPGAAACVLVRAHGDTGVQCDCSTAM